MELYLTNLFSINKYNMVLKIYFSDNVGLSVNAQFANSTL